MSWLRLFLVLMLLSSLGSAQSKWNRLLAGQVHQRVTCAKAEDQAYAIYLPPARMMKSGPRPLLLLFSPGGDGVAAVERHQRAARRFGWIVAGSLNAKNGPFAPNQAAARAVAEDLLARFPVDAERVHVGGMSGGGVVAAWFAREGGVKVREVFLHARGPFDLMPKKPDGPLFRLLPGDADFNFGESLRFLSGARKAGRPAELILQPGGHGWAEAIPIEELFRRAEVDHLLSRTERPRGRLSRDERKLVEEELTALEELIDGPTFLMPWRRYEGIGQQLSTTAPKEKRLLSRVQKKRRAVAMRLPDEEAAWTALENDTLFGAEFRNRYPAAASLEAIGKARRTHMKEHAGTTAALFVLLAQTNTPASLNRVATMDPPPELMKAYRIYTSEARDLGFDLLERADALIAAKDYPRALGCLWMAAGIGKLTGARLKARRWAKLRRVPGRDALLQRLGGG